MEKTSTIKGLSIIVRLNLTHCAKDITINKSQTQNHVVKT